MARDELLAGQQRLGYQLVRVVDDGLLLGWREPQRREHVGRHLGPPIAVLTLVSSSTKMNVRVQSPLRQPLAVQACRELAGRGEAGGSGPRHRSTRHGFVALDKTRQHDPEDKTPGDFASMTHRAWLDPADGAPVEMQEKHVVLFSGCCSVATQYSPLWCCQRTHSIGACMISVEERPMMAVDRLALPAARK